MPAPTSATLDVGSGRQLELRPLSLGQWRKFSPAMQAMAEGRFTGQDEVMDALIDVVHASASRADATVDRACIEDALDWHQAGEAYARVLAISMPATSGETAVASQPGPSTGIS